MNTPNPKFLLEAENHLRVQGKVHKREGIVKATGKDKSSVSKAFSGKKRFLTAGFVSAFNEAFGGIFNEDYLLRGEGTLLKDGTQDEAPTKPQRASNEVETDTSGSRIILRLPIIPIEAEAGIGKGFLYDRDSSQDPDDIYDEFDSMEVFL